ncbi:acetate--CoA ligase family protein [Rhodococcus globerulus]|uniref:acetate--CoA ligase family protein n=2 Tax=Rhodococcus TaxID=1827 RepID=UPI0035563B4E
MRDREIASGLRRILSPRSVAVLGVSGRSTSLTARPVRLLASHGYEGAVYPINPKHRELYGLPCYATLADVPAPIDLVMSFAPPERTEAVIREAGEVGAAAVVILASGFAEVGEAGRLLQARIIDAARESGVRILGPNCLGLINRDIGLFATFSAAADRPQATSFPIAYVGQSGAVGGALLDMANDIGIGFAKWVATGNQADLDIVEVATAFVEDPSIKVILMYSEGIDNGHGFVHLAESARRYGTQLVLLRSGLSEVGRRAAASHTGAMLGDDSALLAAAHRYGVIVVDDLSELLWAGMSLASNLEIVGPRLAVVTTSGGAGILLVDQFQANGLNVAQLASSTIEEIRQIIPPFGVATNPVDVTAQILNSADSSGDFRKLLEVIAADSNVDGIALVLTLVTGDQAESLAEMIANLKADLAVPLWVQWLAGRELTSAARAICRNVGIPIYESPRTLARIIKLSLPTVTTLEKPASSNQTRSLLLEPARFDLGWKVLDLIGVAIPKMRLATSASEAVMLAPELGERVAMKIEAANVAHKSELGGVEIEVALDQVAATYELLVERARAAGVTAEGVLIQTMATRGTELIIGAISKGDGFPPTITVGFGGVMAEIYKDFSVAAAPVSIEQAEAMLKSLKGWPVLDGFRGAAKGDVKEAAKCVSKVSEMIWSVSDQNLEFEINPLIVGTVGNGATAVDVLIRRKSN